MFVSKLTHDLLFLFKVSGFTFLLFTALNLLGEVVGTVYMKSNPFFSATKEHNGEQNFAIRSNYKLKCAISRDNV